MPCRHVSFNHVHGAPVAAGICHTHAPRALAMSTNAVSNSMTNHDDMLQ